MREYATFLWRCFRISFVGDWRYHLWMLVLTVFVLLGLNAYAKQLVYGLALTGMTVVYLATVPFLGPYYDHYRLKSSPFALSIPNAEPPALFEKTEIRRPGVRSVADAYFTFRLLDLLRDPVIRREHDFYTGRRH